MSKRRDFLATTITTAAGAAVAGAARADDRDWSGNRPVRYPDADVVVLDPRFQKYKLGNAAIQRLHSGTAWAEGPAWSAVGRYLLWSDIPNDVQLRRIDDDGHISVCCSPSGNSIWNTFDFEGRRMSSEHGYRPVQRHQHLG